MDDTIPMENINFADPSHLTNPTTHAKVWLEFQYPSYFQPKDAEYQTRKQLEDAGLKFFTIYTNHRNEVSLYVYNSSSVNLYRLATSARNLTTRVDD